MASYRKNHVKNKIFKIKPKKSFLKSLWFWVLSLSFIAVFILLYMVLFIPAIQVENIIVQGNQKISKEEIKSFVLEKTEIIFLQIFDKKISTRSIFLANSGALENSILKNFTNIEKAKVSRKFWKTIKIDITERGAVGMYCTQNNDCFLIDTEGILFEPVGNVFGGSLIVRQAVEPSRLELGSEAMGPGLATAIYEIQKRLKENFQIDLANALVTSPVRINVKTGEGWEAYFDLSAESNVNSQIEKLLILLGGDIKDNRQSLRYVDLRPRDRAIICDNQTCGN